MSARLEIRINPQDKEKLEKLAQYAGMSVSELIRSYVIKLAEVEKTLEALETVGKLERKLVKALIASKPFQELLERLAKYVDNTCWSWVGFHDEKRAYFSGISIDGGDCLDWTIVKEGNYYKLKRVVWAEECNEYGNCWRSEYNPSYEEPQTLSEIADFLDDVKSMADTSLQKKIEEIKSIIK